MSETPENAPAAVPYVIRVFTNEAVKKGAAAAVAGILVAAVSEAIWPSR
jgi:acyl-CoA synthetase (NDP forming)